MNNNPIIKVLAAEWRPYIVCSDEKQGPLKISGPVADLFYYFTRALKINYTLNRAPQGNWGKCYENGTCTGLFYILNEKTGADIALGPIVASEQRMSAIQFSNALFTTEMAILVPLPPKADGNAFGFLLALEPEVWMVTIASMHLVYAAFLFVHFTLKKERVQNPLTRYYWTVCELLLLKGSTWMPTVIPYRLILIFWVMGMFIILSAYGGILTSTFSLMSVPDYVHDLKDFLRFPKVTPIVLSDSGESEYFKNNPSSPYAEIWNRILERDSQLTYVEMYEDIRKLASMMSDTPSALISLRAPMFFLLARDEFFVDCKTRQFFISDPFSSSQVVLPLRRGLDSAILEQINLRILHAQQASLFENSQHAGNDYRICLDKKFEADVDALSIHWTYGVFALWACGNLLSIIIFLIEYVIRTKSHLNIA